MTSPAAAGTTATVRAKAPASQALSSPLYRTGKLPALGCKAEPISGAESAKRALKALGGCLDRAWAKQFKVAGLRFKPPRQKIITKPVKTTCGSWGEAQGIYCSNSRTLYVLVDSGALDSSRLFLPSVLAHEYGHHVQEVARLWDTYREKPKSAELAWSRRYELQAECLAGAFLSSVRTSLPFSAGDWSALLADQRHTGDENGDVRDHGKGANIARWMDRGYRAGSPSACNTFKAPAAHVANTPAA
ncbi:neutral zinc metallopeptidase [Bailinhaonella thermotolerans]|nr:neutral zinc metallopeptidase [Bailinhaonella thermotolerans]